MADVPDIPDDVFVPLARRAGAPTDEQLRVAAARKAAQAAAGRPISLYLAAREADLIPPALVPKYEEFARRGPTPTTRTPVAPPPRKAQRLRSVLTQSAEFLIGRFAATPQPTVPIALPPVPAPAPPSQDPPRGPPTPPTEDDPEVHGTPAAPPPAAPAPLLTASTRARAAAVRVPSAGRVPAALPRAAELPGAREPGKIRRAFKTSATYVVERIRGRKPAAPSAPPASVPPVAAPPPPAPVAPPPTTPDLVGSSVELAVPLSSDALPALAPSLSSGVAAAPTPAPASAIDLVPASSDAPPPPAPVAPPPAALPKKRGKLRTALTASAELVIERVTRRRRRVPEAPRVTTTSRELVLLVALGGIALSTTAAAVFIALRGKAPPRPPAPVVATPTPGPAPAPTPGPPPAPGPAPTPSPAPGPGELPAETPGTRPATPQGDETKLALAEAFKCESAGQEPAAITCLDAAVARASSDEARQALAQARDQILARVRARIATDAAEIEALALGGKVDEGKALLRALAPHVPAALRNELQAAVERINASLNAQWQKAQASAPKGETGPATSAARAAEVERLAALRARLDAALLELDAARARRHLDECGALAEKDLARELELEKLRVDAVARLADFAVAGLKTQVGRDVSLAMRKGARQEGTIASAQGETFVLRLSGGAGERDLLLRELALESVLTIARAGARGPDAPVYQLGRAVVLACAHDAKGALEALDRARSLPGAAELRARVQDSLAAAPAPAPATPATATAPPRPKPPATGPASLGKDPLAKAPPAPSTEWTADTSGALPWDQAYVIETEHYVLRTCIQRKYAERYAKFLEALAGRYAQVFQFAGNDFKYKKNEVILYPTQQDFMTRENEKPHIGGFYEPWSKKIKTFHGPWGETRMSTLTILAHEATHQFENLVVRKLDHAPTFMIEGLACFFEYTEVREDGEVLVGKISTERLASLQRSIRENDSIPLRTLVRTPQEAFTGVHYGHAWALIHWLIYGPEQKKAQRLLDWYWELCMKRPTTADDFEQGLSQIGFTMDKLEASWKQWVLSLDPAKDPAVLLWEQHRKGKR